MDKKYTQYAEDVLSGKIIACEYIKLACKRYLEWMERTDIEFIPSKADRVINFCGKLKTITGRFDGKPFKLELFQKYKWTVVNTHKGNENLFYIGAYIKENGKRKLIYAHRLASGVVDNPDIFVRHINEDKYDNRSSNLKIIKTS